MIYIYYFVVDTVNAFLIMGTWPRYFIPDTLLTKILMDCCVMCFCTVDTYWVLCCTFVCIMGCAEALSIGESAFNWVLCMERFKAANISKHHDELLKQPIRDFSVCIIYFNHSFCLCVIFVVLSQDPF